MKIREPAIQQCIICHTAGDSKDYKMPPAAALVVLPACAEQNTARKPRWLDPVRGRGVASYIDAMRRAHTL